MFLVFLNPLNPPIIPIDIPSYFDIISWFNIYASAFFTALNDGFISALISFVRTFGFQIIMIFVLPSFFELNGLWLSVAVAEVLSLVVSGLCLVLKRKKYQYV